ncbi:MAG: DUF2815 family protein [Hyphomicrobiaceae bacterium]|nr:MAG: DUF2815 family protein [Hyphomicrobiaceae bacterium]
MGKDVKGNVLKLPSVRLSFPSIGKPTAFEEGQEPKYQATFLLDPKDPRHKATLSEIQKEIQRMITEAWGKQPANMKPLAETFGKGDTQVSNKTGEVYDGYEGMYFLKAKNGRKPIYLDRDKNEIDADEAGKLMYGGCYVNATINFWIQDNKWGKAIRANVRGIQFWRDGDAFGGGGGSADEFDDFGDDDAGFADAETDFG